MDVKRLASWTRDELETEARRIGVRSPERLPRHRLVQRIRAHHRAPLRRARRAARYVLDVTRALASGELPPSLEASPRAPEPRPPAPASTTPSGAAGSARVGSEPIPTRTMARILAAQGHRARARAIYAELLAARPDDAELAAEADALHGDVDTEREG